MQENKKAFCTLFDKNYLLKGLALHRSLLKHCSDFKLWILCMDDESYEFLSKLNLTNTELLKLEDFEDPELLKVKPDRKKSEYCWTCTSSLLLYLFKNKPELDILAYLDADLFFYDSPLAIYNEFGNDSVMIIPHHFSPDQVWREKKSGKYNVSMLIFRNDPNSLQILNWWRRKCLDWCFDYLDNGRLGDQMYLDDWLERFKRVYVLRNEGANVGSWNIKKYKLIHNGKKIVVRDRQTEKDWDLIFYHFHGTALHYFFHKIIIRGESMDIDLSKFIFSSYSETLTEMLYTVRKFEKNFSAGLENNSRYIKWIVKKAVLQWVRNMLTFLREVFRASKRGKNNRLSNGNR